MKKYENMYVGIIKSTSRLFFFFKFLSNILDTFFNLLKPYLKKSHFQV